MRRTKSTTRREHMVATSSSSNEDDVSLSVNQEEEPTATHDAVSSSTVLQHRGGVPSKRGQFTRKYETYWKDALSM